MGDMRAKPGEQRYADYDVRIFTSGRSPFTRYRAVVRGRRSGIIAESTGVVPLFALMRAVRSGARRLTPQAPADEPEGGRDAS